jgi:hypothetical protein
MAAFSLVGLHFEEEGRCEPRWNQPGGQQKAASVSPLAWAGLDKRPADLHVAQPDVPASMQGHYCLLKNFISPAVKCVTDAQRLVPARQELGFILLMKGSGDSRICAHWYIRAIKERRACYQDTRSMLFVPSI